MLKKILFISIFLLIPMGCVTALEVPDGFEPTPGMDSYTNNDDKDYGQVIDVYEIDEFGRLFEFNSDVDYSWNVHKDHSFSFECIDKYTWEGYSGIGKHYSVNDKDYIVLFWNKNSDDGEDGLKELIDEFEKANPDIDYSLGYNRIIF